MDPTTLVMERLAAEWAALMAGLGRLALWGGIGLVVLLATIIVLEALLPRPDGGSDRPLRCRCSATGAVALSTTRSKPGASSREQALSGVGIFHEDGADRAILGRLQDVLFGVAGGIDGLGLPVIVEPEHPGGDALAHRIPHAHAVVNPDAEVSRHDASPQSQRTGRDFTERKAMLG